MNLATQTTSNRAFGFDSSFSIYCAFVDTGESADPGANAKVDSYSAVLNGPGNDIRGTIGVSGLDTGDTVIVEVWGILQDPAPSNVTGNVPVTMVDFTTCITTNPCAGGGTGSIGSQTISIQNTQNFFGGGGGASADVSVTKTDGPTRWR